MREDNRCACGDGSSSSPRTRITTCRSIRTWQRPWSRRAWIWIADITYIRLELEFVYLAVILDAFSRREIG
jgi:hypothetical protein